MTVIMYCTREEWSSAPVLGDKETKTHLGGLELPEGDVDGDSALTLGLELVEDPGVLERSCTQESAPSWDRQKTPP